MIRTGLVLAALLVFSAAETLVLLRPTGSPGAVSWAHRNASDLSVVFVFDIFATHEAKMTRPRLVVNTTDDVRYAEGYTSTCEDWFSHSASVPSIYRCANAGCSPVSQDTLPGRTWVQYHAAVTCTITAAGGSPDVFYLPPTLIGVNAFDGELAVSAQLAQPALVCVPKSLGTTTCF